MPNPQGAKWAKFLNWVTVENAHLFESGFNASDELLEDDSHCQDVFV